MSQEDIIVEKWLKPMPFAEWEKEFPEEAEALIAEIGEEEAQNLRNNPSATGTGTGAY